LPPRGGPARPAARIRPAPGRGPPARHRVAPPALLSRTLMVAAGATGATRVLLFTGKGGVGKTTASAATALRCADLGLRTLALSTDPAHSLADALDAPRGALVAPVAGADGLWGLQLDAQDRMEDAWGEIRRYLLDVFRWA